MVTDMKVEVIYREKIKPSSPTPHHLSTLKLCLIDQLAPVMYIPIILFYPFSNGLPNDLESIAQIANHLKKTLSETLTHFYPFAGRIKTADSVECNDDGVEFLEAKINSPMSKILEKPDTYFLRRFLGAEPESEEASKGPLLVVQVTFFQCGGMALGISISHKIADASTLLTFLNSWVATTLGSREAVLPEFKAASLLPPSEPPALNKIPGKCRTRRFVFNPENIAALRCKSASETVKNPTRVEAICSLIWKSITQASRSNNGSMSTSVFSQTVNIRARTVPPLPANLAGNFFGIYPATLDEKEEGDDLKVLVAKLRKGVEEVKEFFSKRGLDVEEIEKAMLECRKLITNEEEINNYNCSSWFRFPFYKLDFGWGKPIWVSMSGLTFKNFLFLLSSRDGEGVEAWLTLKEEEMALVETNQELLAFATSDPSVI